MADFTQVMDDALRRAGWVIGRRVDVSGWREQLEGSGHLPMHEAADEFLSEYGGLFFEDAGPGLTRARESFLLDPTSQIGMEDVFIDWSEHIEKIIFPIGELDNRYPLGMDEDGVIYSMPGSLMRFEVGLKGLEELIVGIMPEVVSEG